MKRTDERAVLRTHLYSTLLIASVAALEIAAGILTNSLAVLGDGFHALYDALIGALLLLTYKISLKPADENHTYGHGRVRTLGTFTAGIFFLFLVLQLFLRAVDRLSNPSKVYLELIGFIALAYTLIIDFILIRTLSRAAYSGEASVKAGLLNSIADFADTIIAILGFTLAGYLNILYADAVAALILAVMIAYLGINLLYETGLELTDAVSPLLVRRIKQVVEDRYGEDGVSYLNVRRLGKKTYVEAGVLVPMGASFASLHKDLKEAEETIAKAAGDEAVVRIQMMPRGFTSLYESIRDSILGVKGVVNVHEVTISRIGEGLFISLHIEVLADMSLTEAHRVADEVERRALETVENVKNVMVHVEPTGSSVVPTKALGSDSQIYLKVKEATEKEVERGFHGIKEIKKIMVFRDPSGSVRVELVVSMRGGRSIAETHDIVSHLEDSIRHAIGEVEVVIHAEPESVT